ncbi:MAG: cytochrome c3 family protein [Bryobacteraceae bacterium]
MRGFLFCLSLRLAATGVALAALALAQQDAACSACHEDTAKKTKGSTHDGVGCSACHPRHEDYPHPAGVAKPECAQCHAAVAREDARGVHGQARRGNQAAPDCGVCHGSPHETLRPSSQQFRQAVPDTCGMCHSEVAAQYRGSVHGTALMKGTPNAPLCTDCHGEHNIIARSQSASPVSPGRIRDTCARCHGDLRLSRRLGLPSNVVVSFDASFHGLAGRSGSQSVANCASCHGYHDILPSKNPKSSVNPKNLPATCGKCHPGAGSRYTLGPIHWLAGNKEPAGVRWVRDLYLGIIPITIGLMLLHNAADWIRKLLRLRLRGSAGDTAAAFSLAARRPWRPEIRMYGAERIQHALLLTSFSVLAWTGFALKYPDQWWARPLLAWETWFPVRATIHRVAGGVLVGVALLHVVSLAVSRRLRGHWREMWPRAGDAREGILNLAHLLGLRSRPPKLSSHGYVEKAEYWAVVWGTAVMAITGVLLWAVNFSLAWLPKSWLDVATAIHFYEAVLATLSIAVWHFYFVIFDPEVYPMDTAWITGESARRRESHHSGETADDHHPTHP